MAVEEVESWQEVVESGWEVVVPPPTNVVVPPAMLPPSHTKILGFGRLQHLLPLPADLVPLPYTASLHLNFGEMPTLNPKP